MMRLEALAFRRIVILGPACSCLLRKVKMQDFRFPGFDILLVKKDIIWNMFRGQSSGLSTDLKGII